MKHERATEGVRQQVALYTLGLLTQHEARCFELHLEECSVCRAEFGKLSLAAAQIGLAVKEAEPPDDFRDRLATRIDWSPRAELLSDFSEEKESEPRVKPSAAKAPKSTARRRSKKTAIVIHTIMYVLLIAAFAYYAWQTTENENSRLQSHMKSSQNDLADLRRQFDSQRENTEKLERFLELFSKPSVHIARLEDRSEPPNNTGAVFLDSLTGEITVVGVFAPVPAGEVYQLWFANFSDTTSVGLLPSDENGNIFTVIKLDESMSITSDITAIVTLESESDSSERAEPEGPWIADGRIVD